MNSTSADIALFAFRDAGRAAPVAAAAGDQPGVRAVAVVGWSADCEIRIISRAGGQSDEARWSACTLAVLDIVSGPLRVLAATTGESDAVTLPDSDDGFAAFGRLIPLGALVILVAACDDPQLAIASLHGELGAALLRRPAECAIRMSARGRRARRPATPNVMTKVARCADQTRCTQ
jgi:hypothetical protein